MDQRLERLDQAVDQCIKVQGGISSQYFYRSMYAVQLYHCFKVCTARHSVLRCVFVVNAAINMVDNELVTLFACLCVFRSRYPGSSF